MTASGTRGTFGHIRYALRFSDEADRAQLQGSSSCCASFAQSE
jgi:hypothetical protein